MSAMTRLLLRCIATFFIPAAVVFVGKLLLDNISFGETLNVLTWGGLKTVRSKLTDGTPADWSWAQECATYFVLTFAMFGLVFFNTILYLVDTYRRGTQADKESKKTIRWLWGCWFGGGLLLLVNFGFLFVLVGWDNASRLFVSRSAAITFFSLFAILDFIAYWAIRQEVTEIEKATAKLGSSSEHAEIRKKLVCDITKCRRDAEYIFKQALYVDIPVVVGLVFVWLFEAYYLTALDELYAQAFASGAIIVHIATSQLLFALVSFQDAWHEYRASDDESSILLVTPTGAETI